MKLNHFPHSLTWDEMQKQRKRLIRIGHYLKFYAKFDEDASIIGNYNNYEYRRYKKMKEPCAYKIGTKEKTRLIISG